MDEPTYEDVLAWANTLNGTDHKRFGDFAPIEVELAYKALLKRVLAGAAPEGEKP